MTYTLFGKNDVLVTPSVKAMGDVFSSDVYYTHGTQDRWYSKYGFAHPITLGSPPLDLLFDDKIPKGSATAIPHHEEFHRYLLVDHEGLVWKIVIGRDSDNPRLLITSLHIDTQYNGWWVVGDTSDIRQPDQELLVGFLYTNPTRKAINAYWTKQNMARDLEWLSITTIVYRLHKDHPRVVESDEGIDLTKLAKKSKVRLEVPI